MKLDNSLYTIAGQASYELARQLCHSGERDEQSRRFDFESEYVPKISGRVSRQEDHSRHLTESIEPDAENSRTCKQFLQNLAFVKVYLSDCSFRHCTLHMGNVPIVTRWGYHMFDEEEDDMPNISLMET